VMDMQILLISGSIARVFNWQVYHALITMNAW
jgi:hypothetical protein